MLLLKCPLVICYLWLHFSEVLYHSQHVQLFYSSNIQNFNLVLQGINFIFLMFIALLRSSYSFFKTQSNVWLSSLGHYSSPSYKDLVLLVLALKHLPIFRSSIKLNWNLLFTQTRHFLAESRFHPFPYLRNVSVWQSFRAIRFLFSSTKI